MIAMAQQRFAQCKNWEISARRQVDLWSPLYLKYEERLRPKCWSGTHRRGDNQGEEKRRPDVPAGKYGSGTPKVGPAISRDVFGIPVPYDGPYVSEKTPEGEIKLPLKDTGPDVGVKYDHTAFLPTVNQLREVYSFDSRMRPLSDRYYRR